MTRPELRKLVVSIPFRDDQFADLRHRFPDIEVASCDLKDLPDHIGGAQAAITWRVSSEALAKADQLAWVQGGGAGVESYLSNEDFVSRNLILTNASGVSAPNMAEHAVAMVLAFARGIPRHVLAQQRHAWRDETIGSNDFELGGQTVFIVGTGAIGSETAQRLRGFNMRIVGVRRNADRQLGAPYDETIGFSSLQSELGRADHVISSLPLTPNTRHMFDAGLFAAFRRGSYFYNLGRGGTVVQGDLMDALEREHLAGAGLDVVEPEPLPADHPLWDTKNVLITSHQSGGSNKTLERLFALVVDNVQRWINGDELRNVVDQREGY